jgi:hypothetical protein
MAVSEGIAAAISAIDTTSKFAVPKFSESVRGLRQWR